MTEQVYEMKEGLINNNIDSFGKILHKGWIYKKQLASVISNSKINQYYNKALEIDPNHSGAINNRKQFKEFLTHLQKPCPGCRMNGFD